MSFTIRLIVILVVLLAIEFYFVKKITGSLKNIFPGIAKKNIKIPVFIGLILFNLYPFLGIGFWIYARITQNNSITAPESWVLDYFIIFPFWIITLIIVQTLLFFLPIDILKGLLYPLYKKHKPNIKKYEARFIFALIIFFSIYVPVRVIYDYNIISVRSVEYVKDNLPQELDGFKITLISDVQADRYTNSRRLNNFIKTANETNPDLLLIAGDVITGSPKYISTAADALGKLESKYGVFSCVGDHDNWAYRYDTPRSLREIKAALINKNIPMLDNENLSITVGDSASIGISFITYTYTNQIDNSVLDSLTNNIDDTDIKIFLTHQPRPHLFNKAVEKKYNLIFAGHTHGGQLTFLFPFFNPSITHLETNYVKGDFWFGNTLMVVTRGLGMSLAPVRYNSTPEVTVIKLQSEKK